MVTEGEIGAAVRAIYRAAIERETADAMLARIVRTVGGSSGWVNDFSATDVSPVIDGFNINPDIAAPYRAHYHVDDPWPKAAFMVPEGVAISLDRFVPDRDFIRTEVYAELLHPGGADIRHNLAMRMDYPGRFRGVAIFRANGREPFAAGEEALMTGFGWHLRRLFAIWDAAPAAQRRIDAFAAGRQFDAAFAVDARSRLVDVNAAGARMLARSNLVRPLLDRTLGWTASADQARVERLLARAIVGGIGGGATVHDGDAIAHRLWVDPWPDADGPAGLLTLRDTAGLIAAQVDAATIAFGLSPGEGALARSLMAGGTIEAHAVSRGTATETVRKQLAALFRKTGASRQAGLVALLYAVAL